MWQSANGILSVNLQGIFSAFLYDPYTFFEAFGAEAHKYSMMKPNEMGYHRDILQVHPRTSLTSSRRLMAMVLNILQFNETTTLWI